MISLYTPSSDKTVALWLLICCALIFAMVVVGGCHAADAVGAFHRRMGPDHGRGPAAYPDPVGGDLQQVQADAGIPEDQHWHVSRGLQGHLLCGVGAPPARARHRIRFSAAVPLLSLETPARKSHGNKDCPGLYPPGTAGGGG